MFLGDAQGFTLKASSRSLEVMELCSISNCIWKYIDAFNWLSNCEAGDNWGVSCFDWIESFCQVYSMLFSWGNDEQSHPFL